MFNSMKRSQNELEVPRESANVQTMIGKIFIRAARFRMVRVNIQVRMIGIGVDQHIIVQSDTTVVDQKIRSTAISMVAVVGQDRDLFHQVTKNNDKQEANQAVLFLKVIEIVNTLTVVEHSKAVDQIPNINNNEQMAIQQEKESFFHQPAKH